MRSGRFLRPKFKNLPSPYEIIFTKNVYNSKGGVCKTVTSGNYFSKSPLQKVGKPLTFHIFLPESLEHPTNRLSRDFLTHRPPIDYNSIIKKIHSSGGNQHDATYYRQRSV